MNYCDGLSGDPKVPQKNREQDTLTRLLYRLRLPLLALLLSGAFHLLIFALISANLSAIPVGTASFKPIELTLRPSSRTIPANTPGEAILANSAPQTANRDSHPAQDRLPEPVRSLTIPALPEYFELSELDAPIKPLESIEPQRPATADPARSGSVGLDLYLNETGTVDSIAVASSTLDADFEQAAINAFRQRRFEPGIRHGKSVRTHLRIVVRFEAGIQPEKAHPQGNMTE